MITLANGEIYETVRILGGTETFQGQQRKTLAITMLASVISFAAAAELYRNAAEHFSEITVETDGETSVQLDFTLPVELKLSEMKLTETDTAEIITIKLAQKSALEKAQEKQAADINDTQLALIELAGMMAGGDSNG